MDNTLLDNQTNANDLSGNYANGKMKVNSPLFQRVAARRQGAKANPWDNDPVVPENSQQPWANDPIVKPARGDIFDQIAPDKGGIPNDLQPESADVPNDLTPEKPDIFDRISPDKPSGAVDWHAMANAEIQRQGLRPDNAAQASTMHAIFDTLRQQFGTPEEKAQPTTSQQIVANQQQQQQLQNSQCGAIASNVIEALHPAGQLFARGERMLAPVVGAVAPGAAQNMQLSAQTLEQTRGNGGLSSTPGQLLGQLPTFANPLVAGVSGANEAYTSDENAKDAGHDVSGWDEVAHVAGTAAVDSLLSKVFSGKTPAASTMATLEKGIQSFIGKNAPEYIAKYGAKAATGALANDAAQFVHNSLYDRPLTEGMGQSTLIGAGVPVLHEAASHATDAFLNRGQTPTVEAKPEADTAFPGHTMDAGPAEADPDTLARTMAADRNAVAQTPEAVKEPEAPFNPEQATFEPGPDASNPETDQQIANAPQEQVPTRRKMDRQFRPDEDRNLISKSVLDTDKTNPAFGRRVADWQDMTSNQKTLLQRLREQKIASETPVERGQAIAKQYAGQEPKFENVPASEGPTTPGELGTTSNPPKNVPTPAERNKTITPSLYKRAGTVAIPTAEDVTGPGSIYGEEIKPKLQSMAGGLNKVWNGFKSMFPVETGSGHEETQGIARQRFSEETNNQQRAEAMLGDARDGFDKMSPDDRMEFQRRMYNQEDQPTPELQGIAKKMYADTNEGRKALEAVGHDAAKDWDDQKWNMLWKKDPQKAESLMQMLSRPGKIEGKKTFLKKQTLSDFDEGLSKGLVPKYDNPIDMFLATKAERGKYLAGVRTMEDMHKSGIVKKIGADADVPEGYGEVPAAAKGPLGRITGSKPSDAVKYIAPDGANRILDNITKPSAFASGAPGAIYKGLMTVNNTLTQAMLGLSGFHIRKVTQEMINLNVARAMEGTSLKPIGESSPFRAIARGADVQKTMLGLKAAGSPEEAKAIDYMIKSGFTAKGDSTYETAWQRSFKKALADGGVQGLIRAGMKALPAANEKLMQDGVFKYVQHAKLSIGADMMSDAIKKLGPGASDAEILKQGRKISDHLDNVLGMMNRDNLFWNRTARDLATLSTLSVGWNYGSLRALGGGVKDAVTNLGSIAKGANVKDLDMKRVSYLASTATLTALTGAVTTYLATGKPPQRLIDYIHPPTGNKDRNGHDIRLDTGFYVDDWSSFMHRPLETMEAKASPLLHAASALLTNKDAGVRVRQSDDPWYQQAAQVAKYLGKAATPLSVKQLVDTIEGGGSEGKSLTMKLAPFMGVKTAPKALSMTPAELLANDMLNDHAEIGGRTQVEAERSQLINRLVAGVKNREPGVMQEYLQALRDGRLRPSDVKTLHERIAAPNGLAGLIKDSRLQPGEVMKVWEKASPDEKRATSLAVRGRIGRSGIAPEEKRAYFDRINADMKSLNPN